jgi:hypothetical protein
MATGAQAADRRSPTDPDGRDGVSRRTAPSLDVSDEGGFPPDQLTGSDSDSGELRDYVITDDLIVDGSACIGNDCESGEVFDFDTIRLRENNLRIKFDDTSTIAGYAANDWEITINDSQMDGISRFSILDVTAGRTPFTIRAGAPNDALYVSAYGNLGIGTPSPVQEIHTRDSDTPTLRLEQDMTGGWTPQTWDVAGNETNFFVRDVTHGSRLPVRIRAGAPSNSIHVAGTGDVGLGTDAPEARLHVEGSLLLNGAPSAPTLKVAHDSVNTFALDENGNVFLGGVLFEASSREVKKILAPVDGAAVLHRLATLPLWEWNYVHDDLAATHVGPVAEDFAAAFGLGAGDKHLAAMDVSGIALSGVQALLEEGRRKDEKIAALETRLAVQEAQQAAERERFEDLLVRLRRLEENAAER